MEIDPQILGEIARISSKQTENPVRIEKNLVQKNLDKDKTSFLTVNIGKSYKLTSPEKSHFSVVDNQQNLHPLDRWDQSWDQLLGLKEPLVGSNSQINRIRGGKDFDSSGKLGKSGPGSRARADAASRSRTSGSGILPTAKGFTSEPNFLGRPNRPLTCRKAKLSDDQFQPNQFQSKGGRDNNNQPPNSSTEDSTREIIGRDGVKGILTDKSSNHLTSKHGHEVGIEDRLPPDPNQKPKKYPQIRTRLNPQNKQEFADILEMIANDPDTEPMPDIDMRGTQSHGYFNPNYGEPSQEGFFIGIHTEGEFKGQIMKAQSVSDQQLKGLLKNKRID